MSAHEKTAVSGTSTDSGEQMQLENFPEALPVHFTPAKGTIASILLFGQENALTAGEIAMITGLDRRKVTDRIRWERAAGAPIISNPESGFWLSDNRIEIWKCAAALHTRAGEIHRTARALEKTARGGDHAKESE